MVLIYRKYNAMPGNSRGVALITALLIVALAITAAVTMVSRQQLDIRRTGNLLQMEQSYLYVQWAEDFSAHILRDDLDTSTVDIETEDWATELPPMPVEGGSIAGKLTDMQSRFNINSMVQAGAPSVRAIDRFRNLLTVLGENPDLAYAVVDWIDSDRNGYPVGSEPSYYGKEPAYLAANRAMASPSELLLVEGFTTEIYKLLKDHVSALPETVTGINVNTASAEVLMSLARGITRIDADALISARGVDGFLTVNDFVADAAIAGRGVTTDGLDVSSSYFMVNSIIELGQAHLQMQSLIHRESPTNIYTVARAQGTY